MSAPTRAPAAERAAAPSAPRFELMPETFPRSAFELEGDGFARTLKVLLLAGTMLCAWTAWLFLAQVSLVMASRSARIEVEEAARPLEARVSGFVVANRMALNQEVKAGDVLAELDTKTQQLLLEEQLALKNALVSQLAAIRGETAAYQRSVEQTDAARRSAGQEAGKEEQESEAMARLAESEAARSTSLHGHQLVSEAEMLRRQLEAQQRRADADRGRLAANRSTSERHAIVAAMNARLAELNRDAHELQGRLDACVLTIERAERAIEERRIRAPTTGRIDDVLDLQPGEFVEAGASFGTVVPAGRLKVVASFAPGDSVGRVRTGQLARLRLDGFSWAEYGTVPLRVTAVGGEARDGRIRVELELSPGTSFDAPLQHGLTGTVEVDTERISPAHLVLRKVTGPLFARQGEAPPSAEPLPAR